MSRLISPVRFVDWTDLFKKMKAKHTADGAASILIAFLTENNIDLTLDENAVTAAEAFHILFDKKEKEAERIYEKRDVLFNPAWEEHTRCAQYLKKFHFKNIQKLGDYGITVNGKKIVYPVDFDNRKIALVALADKHFSFVPVTDSPLHKFITDPENDIDLAQNKLDANEAKAQHDLAEQANRDKEEHRIDRDNAMNPVKVNLEKTGVFIMGHYPKNPKKAGDWGFVVDDSPRAPKLRITKLKLSEAKTITGVTIGGTLTVVEGSVKVYKGKTQTGTATVLNAGQQMGITKGNSVITAVNSSDLNPAKISVLRSA